jgi:hypothetical protein
MKRRMCICGDSTENKDGICDTCKMCQNLEMEYNRREEFRGDW